MLLAKLAWRNIGRGWRRSLIVFTAVVVGLTACLLMVGWSKGMVFQMRDNAIRALLAHIAIQAQGYHQDPDVRRNLGPDGDRLFALAGMQPGVHVSARVRGEGLIQSARRNLRVSVVGVDPVAEAGVSSVPGSLVEGAFLSGSEGRRGLPPVVIGRAMAQRLRVDVGNKVVLHVPGEAGLGAFRVRGVYKSASSEFDRSVAYLRFGDARRLFAIAGATEIAISLDRPSEAPAVQAALRAATEDALGAGVIDVLRWEERAPRLASLIEWASAIYWIFYAVIFVAMAFGIANALLMSVYERIREFGVLRSLGLNSRRLVALVLLESTLLTLAGTLAGLAAGAALVGWMGRSGVDLSRFSAALEGYGIGAIIYPQIETGDLLWPVGLAIATALLAATWPAIKAARLRPAEALRAV